MDEFLFDDYLERYEFIPEETKCIELLSSKGAESQCYSTGIHKLSNHGFGNFVTRKGVFSPPDLTECRGRIRLVIQDDLQETRTFYPNVTSFTEQNYKLLVREMRLSSQVAESSSVVGPFFWWAYVKDANEAGDDYLQMLFRKSDVSWKGTSRGWEMALTYSFRTRITSGYIRGTSNAGIGNVIINQLESIIQKSNTSHPFLLPLLMLSSEVSGKNERRQREVRDRLRDLEGAVGSGGIRYTIKPADGYGPDTDIKLDEINRELAELQCKVMWKRPQAWQKVVTRMNAAVKCFWEMTSQEDKGRDLESLHKIVLARLDFTATRLEGLESYTQVSLERLNIQREVMNSFISQRESRLSLAIAAQQRRLAHATGKDSTSMKTLTLMGAMFLPGAFLSSVFSMSFFNFGNDITEGSVSPRVWIYFVTFIPLTLVILGAWWMFDRQHTMQVDAAVTDAEINQLETEIMQKIRSRTGARVMTQWLPGLNRRGHLSSETSRSCGDDAEDGEVGDFGATGRMFTKLAGLVGAVRRHSCHDTL